MRVHSAAADAFERLTGTETPTMTRTDTAALTAATLALVDGLMTLPHWHLEGNPVVLWLGPTWMMAVKLTAVTAMLSVWFGWPGVRASPVARTAVWSLTAIYAVVIVTNVIVLAVVA